MTTSCGLPPRSTEWERDDGAPSIATGNVTVVSLPKGVASGRRIYFDRASAVIASFDTSSAERTQQHFGIENAARQFSISVTTDYDDVISALTRFTLARRELFVSAVSSILADEDELAPGEPPELLVGRVRTALEASEFDWRTPVSLAKELEVAEADIRSALVALGDDVRQPIAADGEEKQFYRLASRGLTWQEKVRKARLILGRTPPRTSRDVA